MSFCAIKQILLTLLLLAFAAAYPSAEYGRANFVHLPVNSSALKAIGQLGIIFGAIEAEAAIEKHLQRLLREMDELPTGQRQHTKEVISKTLHRSEIALEILGAGLKLIASRQSNALPDDYRRALDSHVKEILPTDPIARNGVKPISFNSSSEASTHVKRQVELQVTKMRHQLAAYLKRAIRSLGDSNNLLATNLTAMQGMESVHQLLIETLPKLVRFDEVVAGGLKRHANIILGQQQDEKRQGRQEIAISVDAPSSNESESMESSEEEEGPGGLVGLIASLSGGDEGSDVGALIGSLSAAITNLFGPGGLDVPGLLGTGTSLIAGLLGGDDNFGKVLGSYVGIAIEGLSGGGADMNGAFFGNFLGALIAALSSDPEDDNLPLKPKLFVENFFTGLEEAKRKSDPNADAEQCCQNKGGSDLFAFIGNIVSSIVSGVTSLVLNASLGSFSGTSQGSVAASGASSEGSSGSSGDHSHPKM